jgi:hypothetical protein
MILGRLLIFAGVVLGAIWLFHWFRKTPPARVARTLRKAAIWGGIAILLLAIATGRLNPIFAAIAALIPVLMRLLHLLQMLPALQQLLRSLGIGVPGVPGGGGPAGGAAGGVPGGAQVSAIRTRFLEMRLDHGTGTMDGEVLDGPFAGRRLSDLGLDELLRMLELYGDSDSQSAALLETYLDRERGADWRERGRDGARPAGQAQSVGGPMTESEALAILGLPAGADPDSIRAAHRRLMQKLHPDRGGSDYLAAKINQAKDLLLGERTGR